MEFLKIRRVIASVSEAIQGKRLPRRQKAPRNDNTKKGFSLAELLITLIIVSCILAAFAPVITKRMANGGVNIGGGTTITQNGETQVITSDGQLSDNCADSDCDLCFGEVCVICNKECPEGQSRDYMHCKCVDCTPFDANCDRCSSTQCKICKNGYIINSSGKCDSCENLPDNQYCNGKETVACPRGYSCEGGASTICPENTYSTGGSSGCLSCASNQYASEGSTECLSCTKFHSKCKTCAPDGCKSCQDGYIISGTKCVEDKSDILYYKGLAIYKYNAGDKGGPAIPSTVTVVDAGTSCNGYCCWKATATTNTADSSCTSAYGTSSYSGCKRTVCTWSAADTICRSIDDGSWRLPTAAEVLSFSTLYYNKGSSGLQLCDSASGYGTTVCPRTGGNGPCRTSGSNYCDPKSIWRSDYSGGHYYTYQLDSGVLIENYWNAGFGASVRCVKNIADWPDNCEKATVSGDCSVCESGYTLKGGQCVYDLETDERSLRYNGLIITKFNAGDQNGPPIPPAVTKVPTGTTCTASGGCCWEASSQDTANTGCTATSGTSKYSGCRRTVCTWRAANTICDSITDSNGISGKWRLPSPGEFNYFEFLNYNKGADGLQLCDNSSGYGTTACPRTGANGPCRASSSNYCDPKSIWRNDFSSNNYYTYQLDSGILIENYWNDGFGASVRCVKDDPNFPANCLIANEKNKCTECKPGFKLKNGACEYVMEKDIASLRYNGLIITKYNAGDLYGPSIPSSVSIVPASRTCTASGGCCWKYLITNTANSGCTSSYGTNQYSGCTRTVCTRKAAEAICSSALDSSGIAGRWRLPSALEIRYADILTYNLGSDGLQLCDESSGYGTIACPRTGANGPCRASSSNYCDPKSIWRSDITGSNYYTYQLDSGILIENYWNDGFGASVRCVKIDPNFPQGCLIADENDKCTQCKSGYTLTNGACTLNLDTLTFNGLEITKFNAGDEMGPPIPSDIYVVSSGGTCKESTGCCWKYLITNTANSTCTNSSGSSSYSGCTRTVCDWNAANKICSALGEGWRLPNGTDIAAWKDNLAILNTNKGASGLQLCDENAGYGTTACPRTGANGPCRGSSYNYCDPKAIWRSDISGSNYYTYQLVSGSLVENYWNKSFATSVRCVREVN